MKSKQTLGSLMLLFASLLWGGSYSIQTIMSNYIGPFSAIFLKASGGLLIIAFCLITKRRFNKQAILAGILIGVINGLGLLCQQLALSLSSVSNVSFISGLYIIFVPLIGLFINRKPSSSFWIAMIIACSGLYMLCLSENLVINFGDLITLLSALMFALQILLIDKYSKSVDPIAFCGVQQTTSTVLCFILMILSGEIKSFDISNIILPTLYVIFISGITGQIIQNKYQSYCDPSVASLVMSFESVFGALSGIIFLSQPMSLREIMGCILIFVAIIIAQKN